MSQSKFSRHERPVFENWSRFLKNEKQDERWVAANKYFPQHAFRMIINGKPGAGKTSLALNVLKYCHKTRVWVVAANTQELLYSKLLPELLGVEPRPISERPAYGLSSNLNDLPSPEDVDPERKHQTIVIIDDQMLKSKKDQHRAAEFFQRVRKQNCAVMYLTQRWFSTPDVIRAAATVIITFLPNTVGGRRRLAQELAVDFSPRHMLDLLCDATRPDPKNKKPFLYIDKEVPQLKYRYRRNVDTKLKI